MYSKVLLWLTKLDNSLYSWSVERLPIDHRVEGSTLSPGSSFQPWERFLTVKFLSPPSSILIGYRTKLRSKFTLFIFSLNMLRLNRGCVYVCMHVCVCMCVRVYVCGNAAAQTDGSILMKLSTKYLTDICEVFFSDFEILKWWRHGS